MILYNNTFLPQQDLKLPFSNRAFQYNDGFFETIIVKEGKLCFWQDHQARMQEAGSALHLAIPDYFWEEEMEENLVQFAKQNNAAKLGRIKLKVWRAGAGLYTPQTNEVEWLATVEITQPIPDTGIEIGICQTVKTCFSPLSHFKGPHAPLYVLAGIEKQAKVFDDMLLLNAEGYIAELISSNIFWKKGDVLYTPTLETGCVNGILRRNILRWYAQQGKTVQETLANPKELEQADCVFGANVTGIRGIEWLEGNQLQINDEWLQNLKASLQL